MLAVGWGIQLLPVGWQRREEGRPRTPAMEWRWRRPDLAPNSRVAEEKAASGRGRGRGGRICVP